MSGDCPGARPFAGAAAPTQDHPMPITVAYTRCSTSEQAESGLGLEAQRTQIERYAELYGVTVDRWVVDEGQSAKNLDRPGVAEVLAGLDSREVEGVIVAKLDRLTRSVRDAGDLVERYFASGRARLISVGEQIDTTTAAGRLVLNVLASVGQWEREAIGERTRAALASKRAKGERVGTVPYGYRAASGRLVPHAPEQAAITRALQLRRSGSSQAAIAASLQSEGFPPRGRRWHRTTVARILGR